MHNTKLLPFFTFDFHITFAPGDRLRHFGMTIGPHEGTYKTCGGGAKYTLLSTGETKLFYCGHLAMGNSLKIEMLGHNKVITLCEVQLYGTGMYMTILHCNQ